MKDKLLNTKALLKTVFIHEDYYVDAVLASFASRSHICLLGFRGSGKTHLAECLLKTISSDITATQQGYLSAELEDVFARPDIPSLLNGKEEVKFKKMVKARIKFFDEIQRLGVGALSAMFRLLTNGTIMYFDKEEGVKDFWLISTANPTELEEDTLNVRLPSPLWDRFDAVLWVPIAKTKHMLKITDNIQKLKEALPIIWNEEDILKLWAEVENVKINDNIYYIITLISRIMGFCKFAQDYDGSSLTEAQKRELCSKCSATYICSRIAKPASVRANLSLIKLSKGFAYLRGSSQVELIDLEKAFPLVFWQRIKLMEDQYIANRLNALQNLYKDLITEINEAKDIIDLVNELKVKYSENKYKELENWINSKIWAIELKEDLDEYYTYIHNQLAEKFNSAKTVEEKIKIYAYASLKLPQHLAEEFKTEGLEIELTDYNLAKLAKISVELFNKAKQLKEQGNKTIMLFGKDALKWVKMVK
jgi:MoxR-like ATPase